MWLDDLRPAPNGWVHVRSVDEAKRLLLSELVDEASLDHDLGMCEECVKGFDGRAMHCKHIPTGYDLVVWMAEWSIWPRSISVHSMNAVGRANMVQAIRERKQ